MNISFPAGSTYGITGVSQTASQPRTARMTPDADTFSASCASRKSSDLLAYWRSEYGAFGDVLLQSYRNRPLPSGEQMNTLIEKYGNEKVTPDRYQDFLRDLVDMGVLKTEEAKLVGWQEDNEQYKLGMTEVLPCTPHTVTDMDHWNDELHKGATEVDDNMDMRVWLKYQSGVQFVLPDKTGECMESTLDRLHGYVGSILNKVCQLPIEPLAQSGAGFDGYEIHTPEEALQKMSEMMMERLTKEFQKNDAGDALLGLVDRIIEKDKEADAEAERKETAVDAATQQPPQNSDIGLWVRMRALLDGSTQL